MKIHCQIGAGTAGIMTAAQLRNKNRSFDVVIIDPSDKHYYQPAWTLVGAGAYDFSKTAKPMSDLIPEGMKWIKDEVIKILPDDSEIETNHGIVISYN